MIEIIATLVVVAIMLGVAWRIYYCWRNEELLQLAGAVEAQLRRLRPPPQLSWMQRQFGLNWIRDWVGYVVCGVIFAFMTYGTGLIAYENWQWLALIAISLVALVVALIVSLFLLRVVESSLFLSIVAAGMLLSYFGFIH